MQTVVDSFNLRMDSAQHREGWSGSVTDVLGVIKGKTGCSQPGQCTEWLCVACYFVILGILPC